MRKLVTDEATNLKGPIVGEGNSNRYAKGRAKLGRLMFRRQISGQLRRD